MHRHRLRLLLKQKRFRHPQGLLLKRQRIYKQTIKHLQGELEVQPRSSKILEQLKAALEGLHFIERYLALFPSDTLLGDHFHQERLLVEDAMSSSDFRSTNSRGGFWTVLLDAAFHALLGAPEEEDFTEEMHILSLYDDCPPTAPLTLTFPKWRTPEVHQRSLSLQQSSSAMQVSPDQICNKDSSAFLDQSTTEEYSNPLYGKSPTVAVRSTRKTAPVNEVFEGSDHNSASASNDSIEHNSTELSPPSIDYVTAKITEDDSYLHYQDQVG